MGFSEKQREILRFPYQCYDALICDGAVPVSYTHLDVYKRQPQYTLREQG